MKLKLMTMITLFSPFAFALELTCASSTGHTFKFTEFLSRSSEQIARAESTSEPALFSKTILDVISKENGVSGTKTVYQDLKTGAELTLISSSFDRPCGRGSCDNPGSINRYSAYVKSEELSDENRLLFTCY